MTLTKPPNLALVPPLRQRPCPEIPLQGLRPFDALQQRDEQNTENPGTMFASPTMEQHTMPSGQMDEHPVHHGSHALEPIAAIEPAPLLDVQPTMLFRVLQLVWEVVLGTIHDRISEMKCPTFGVPRLTDIQRSIVSTSTAPDAPCHDKQHQEHWNTTTLVLAIAGAFCWCVGLTGPAARALFHSLSFFLSVFRSLCACTEWW